MYIYCAFPCEQYSDAFIVKLANCIRDDTHLGRPKTSLSDVNSAAVKTVEKKWRQWSVKLSAKDMSICTSISKGGVDTT